MIREFSTVIPTRLLPPRTSHSDLSRATIERASRPCSRLVAILCRPRPDKNLSLRDWDLDRLFLKASEDPFPQFVLDEVLIHELMHLHDQSKIEG